MPTLREFATNPEFLRAFLDPIRDDTAGERSGDRIDIPGCKPVTYEAYFRWLGRNTGLPPATALDALRSLEAGGDLALASRIEAHQASIRADADAMERQKRLSEELVSVAKDLAEGTSHSATLFSLAIGFVGEAQALDVLYSFHPEFRELPEEDVQSVIAEYLGDTLVLPRGVNVDADVLPQLAPLLRDQTLLESTYWVLLRECIRTSFGKEDEEAAIEGFLWMLQDRATGIENEGDRSLVEALIERLRVTVEEVQGIKIPDRIVPRLRPGRRFPDFAQRVNIRSIVDDRRLLIADDMGMGKSASAILGKEVSGASCALVLVPSNVLSNWSRYLSDGRGGYFTAGNAPRIRVIESGSELAEDLSGYEYVLVSHEMLRTDTGARLMETRFDMLIVDEVHKLKNLTHGLRSDIGVRLAETVSDRDGRIVLLSGTPAPDRIQDIAVCFKLLDPDMFPEENGELVRKVASTDMILLRRHLLPRMHRREGTRELLKLPERRDIIERIELSQEEREVYSALLEIDDLEGKQKLQLLRKFLLSPKLLGLQPGAPSTKMRWLQDKITTLLGRGKQKIVVFVNGLVQDVLRGEEMLIEELHLPEGVRTGIIEGEVGKRSRERIRRQFQEGEEPMVLFVSGKTADVGIDLSAGDAVIHLDLPWSIADLEQHRSRVDREGRATELECYSAVVTDTVDQGVEEHVARKHRVIEKLLRSIPITEAERRISTLDQEKAAVADPEVAEWLHSDRRLRMLHGKLLNSPAEHTVAFIERNGAEYAEHYARIRRRSYQANAARVTAAILDAGLPATNEPWRVLDIASGPEMLRSHAPSHLQPSVTSFDVNVSHFARSGGDAVGGSFTALPFRDASFDACGMALAFQDAAYAPRHGHFDRLDVLLEASRVLKPGGILTLTFAHTLTLKYPDAFQDLVQRLGFRVYEDLSGVASAGTVFTSPIVTLERLPVPGVSREEALALPPSVMNGLKISTKGASRLRNQRKVITSVQLNGRAIPLALNDDDQRVMQMEHDAILTGRALIDTHGSIEAIPEEALAQAGYRRVRTPRPRLFIVLPDDAGVIFLDA